MLWEDIRGIFRNMSRGGLHFFPRGRGSSACWNLKTVDFTGLEGGYPIIHPPPTEYALWSSRYLRTLFKCPELKFWYTNYKLKILEDLNRWFRIELGTFYWLNVVPDLVSAPATTLHSLETGILFIIQEISCVIIFIFVPTFENHWILKLWTFA